MKELPYLKFYTGEYLTGNITICDLKTQGLFINICCYYWNRQGHYPLANAKQRFSKYEKELNELLESNILKVEGDNIVIEFLDEQLNERESLSQVRAKAGHKGGLAKAKHLISKRVAKRSNIEENKKREEKEKKKNYAEFVKLSEKEHTTCIEKHGEQITKKAIKKLNDYKQASGKKYKSDYGAMNSWVFNEITKTDRQPSNGKPTVEF